MDLFEPLRIRSLTLRNRAGVSPMCQYSCDDGMATDWHLVHLGARAVGGFGLVFVEATAVEARGRISPADMGLWKDAQTEPLARVARFVRAQGAAPGIQLAHAGRKASTAAPWNGGGPVPPEAGGWVPLGPSPLPFAERYPTPEALSEEALKGVVTAFRSAAQRARAAGFEVVEIHAAHGYLLHSFLSPLSNHRSDGYGGSLEHRMRLTLEVARGVREAWGDDLPVFVRISATDWVEGGWSLADTVTLARELKRSGVDVVDCSSGGVRPGIQIPTGPGYQVPFAERVRRDAGIATAAVGMITEPEQANRIVASGRADLVLLAREALRSPNWPLHAADALGRTVQWPVQYERAKPVR